MKTFLSLFALSCIACTAFAQAPQKFSYQSVIRNAGNQLVANQSVGIKISVLQGSANGAAVYTETHSPLTNANGLATLEIGGGTVQSGNFANINWASGPYFVKTETDLNGGSNYTITSTTQLLSVPYALYAANAGNSTPGPAGPQGPAGNPATDDQQLAVSATGDTLYLQNGGFVIIPSISAANNGSGMQTGISEHSCGANNVHNPSKTYGTMTDQQGNLYKTIVIGNQEWMAENLRTTVYRNGEPIANVTDITQWAGLTTGAWCYHENDSQYECPYAKLYNWYVVADPRNVCPTGWHLPTDAEWSVLINYLDPNADGGNYFSNYAGGKMKSAGLQFYWESPNQIATNASGFSGLPGGFRNQYGTFNFIGGKGYWWSSSENATDLAWCRYLLNGSGGVDRITYPKEAGFSVRCLKD